MTAELSNILIMNHRYPFENNTPHSSYIELVRLRRKFQQKQLNILKNKVYTHYNINHPSVIKIVKAFESQKKKYFDIFFEYVPTTFRSQARCLSYAELQQKKLELLSLCSYLISIHIHPIITQDLIGITANKQIKLYVDIDYSPIVGSVQELIRAKQIEVSNIFKLYQRASLFQSSSPQVNNNQYLSNSIKKSNDLVQTFKKQLQKQKINNTQLTESMKKYTSISQDKSNFISYRERELQALQKSKSLNILAEKIIYQAKQQGSLKSSYKNVIPVQKNALNHCHNSYKSMKPQKDTKNHMEFLLDEYNNCIAQNKNAIVNNQLHLEKQKQTPKQYMQEMMRQPRFFRIQQNNYHQIFEEEEVSVVDTYKEELGSEKKMPKIRNHEFRQTTKEPPKINIPSTATICDKSRNSWDNDFQSDRLPMLKHQFQNRRQIKQMRPKYNQKQKSDHESFKAKNEEGYIRSPRGEYKLQNGYYYQQAFGFGFQKNDPLTKQFISLFEDGNQYQQLQPSPPVLTFSSQNDNYNNLDHQKPQIVHQSNMQAINQKVRSALNNSMKTLQMFAKLKFKQPS